MRWTARREAAAAAVAFAARLLAVSSASANGVISEEAAGGLVFAKTDTIAIASEDLVVSMDEVRVSYVYVAKGTEPQSVTMSFPMPDVSVGDGPDSIIFTGEHGSDPRNYMRFSVTVDGRAVETRLRERALLDGREVTAALRAAKVPLIYVHQGAEAVKALSPAERDKLVADGLLIRFDEGTPSYGSAWTYQVVFDWQQTFPPGATRVDIRYTPITGSPSDIGDAYENGRPASRACVDDAVRSGLARLKKQGGYEVLTLGYVLTTAQFWSGPIGRFRLVVDKGKPRNLVAFCPPDAKKLSDTQFEWTARDFTPRQDLHVIFYTPY